MKTVSKWNKYYEAKKELYKERARAWSLANPNKRKEICKKYSANSKDKHSCYETQRRKEKKQATPVWADLAAIDRFYRDRPKGFEVDHIIPLKNPNVSGLHVEWNLQYLTSTENRKKGNKL